MAKSVSKNFKLSPGDIIEFTDQNTIEHSFSGNIKPQKIPLKILYEDDYYLIISKDAGISVHPSPGRYENTLVNALLFYFKNHDKNYSYIMDSMNVLDRISTMDNMESLEGYMDNSSLEGTDGPHSGTSIGVNKTYSNSMENSTEGTDGILQHGQHASGNHTQT